MVDFLHFLKNTSYPGRGILVGKDRVYYFIMGRSENSRNRVFVKTDDGIRTEAFDPAKLADPSLIIYHPVRTMGSDLVVTNGDQTDTICEHGDFRRGLMTREYEPDEPNWTPRISAIVHEDGSFEMSILKHNNGRCLREFFCYEGCDADKAYFISTYQGDGTPLPTFAGEPMEVSVPSPEEVWDALNEDNKVSLYANVNGEVKYVWHFSNPSVSDQNSWYVAGDAYIKEKYPTWVAVHDPYYSNQDPAQSVSVGESILDAYADVDVIICNDSTALPGQCKAAENKGLTAKDITITGFCTPSGMTSYLENGICTRWGLWDCGIQGAMGCYLAAYISAGNTVKVGDKIDIPSIGTVEVLANDALVAGQETAAENNGVVLLPERVVFTAENVADYNF